MADESMAIDQEVNGEEADDTRVNGVELQDTSEEAVTLNAKDIGNIPLPGESVGESEESEDQVIDSPVRLNLEEDTEDEVMQNVDKLEKEENSTIEDECNDNTNGKEDEETDIPETPVASNSRKRKLSSNEDNDQDLRGFETPAEPSPLIKKRVDKLEKDIREAELESQKWRVTLPPAKRPHLSSPAHNSEIPSRPSSGLSHRSESDLIGGNGSDLSSSAANSPSSVPKNRKSTVDLSSPLYRLPMEQGWKRELVYRATLDQYQRRQGDIYYYTPQGKKLRSNREVSEHLSGTGLTIEHFTFFKEPLGIDDPDKEIIRDAKLMRTRTESPVNVPEKSTPVIKEGKRTPKPKGPKGTSPERGVVNSPKLSAPFKVKSFGSRLSNTNLGTPAKGPVKETAKPAPAKKTPVQWKKNSDGSLYAVQSQTRIDASGNFLPTRLPAPASLYGSHPGEMSPKSGRELCSIHCPAALNRIPSLQCSLCLCLYHEACAGVQGQPLANFVCKSCQVSDFSPSPPPLTHVSALKPTHKPVPGIVPPPPVLQRIPKEVPPRIPQPLLVPVIKKFPIPRSIKTVPKVVPVSKGQATDAPTFRPIQPKKKGIVGSVTTWLPPASSIQLSSKPTLKQVTPSAPTDMNLNRFPQTIAILHGRKYIIVPKHNILNVSSQFSGNGSNLNPKQAENAPKLPEMSTSNQQTAGNPMPPLKPIKLKKIGDTTVKMGVDEDVTKSDSIESEQSEGFMSNVNICETVAKITEEPFGEEEEMSHTRAAVVESQSPPPGDKKKPKPAVTPKPPTPKPAATPKTPKGGKAGENGTPTGKKGRGKAAAAEEKKESAKPNQEASLKALMQCGMFVNVFGYLNKRELAAAARVCRAWRDIAYTRSLWRSVRMKNSQVTDWQGLAATLKRQGTRHLDLRKMLLPPDDTDHIWDQFTKHIASVDSLLRIELCRCPASVVERVCKGLPQLQALIATSIRCAKLDPAPLGRLTNLTELRIKGMNGLNLSSDLKCLEHLTKLKHLSITSIREFEKQQCECIGQLSQLECLELGECTLSGEQGAQLLAPLKRLTRLRLERSPSEGAHLMLHAAAKLPLLTHLELINFEIKAGVEDALAACTNVRRLLIIPMYVSQSATTNWCVLDGVLRLRSTLTHLVWGVTIELLRVTELFIDQCDRPTEGAARPVKPVRKAGMGDCIPVLKPVPGMCAEVAGNAGNGGPARVEILPLPALQRLLTTELPDTRLKILRIPFHATWRQALSDLD